MKISADSKTSIGSAILIVTMVLSTLFSFQATQHQIASRMSVLHTYEVINQLNEVLNTVRDAETGQRGYLLAHDEKYLEPYYKGVNSVKAALAKLRKLTETNAEQQHRIGTLTVRLKDKFDEMQSTLDSAEKGDFDMAVAVVKSDRGKRDMDEIRQLFDEMISVERGLLDKRMAYLKQATANATIFAFSLNVFAMVLLVVAVIVLQIFFVARSRAENRLSIQYAVAKILNDSESLSEAISGIQQYMCEILHHSAAATWLVDQDKQTLRCFDVWHSSQLAKSDFIKVTKSRTFDRGEGLPGTVWQSGAVALVNDVTQDAQFQRAAYAKEIGLISAFAFPIKHGGEVLGICEFFSMSRDSVDQIFLDMLAAIGTQIGQFMVRKDVELEVANQEYFVRLILDTMSDGIVVADKSGKFVLSNQAAEQLVGRLEDVPPQEWSNHFGLYESDEGELVPADELPLARAMRGESVDNVEMYVRSSVVEGEWISVSGRPVKSANHEGGMVVFRDISEKKEADKRVSEFYSTVSHELRTPLTSIRGSLGLIDGGLAGAIPEKASKLIKIAMTESERLIRLINDILDLRKIEAGKLELKKRNVDSQDLIRRTLEGIQGMAQSNGITLDSRLSTGGQIFCDEDRVIQVLTNLVSNAIKFSTSGSKVTVTLEPGANNNFRFSVIDTGQGIPEDQQHKLFGKFQQIDQSDSRKKDGTGLGLAITKMIVEQHGGKIGVKSEVGQGSTFWFELPATFSPVRSTGTYANLPAGHVRPALIVEDDDAIAETLKVHLSSDGFEVLRARTLEEAERLLQMYRPLVILLDLGLPDGDGLDFLQRLEQDEAKRTIPVVIITARDQEGNSAIVHPTLLDWIAKPYDAEQLHLALDSARRRIGPAHVLLVEDDPSTREILKQQIEALGVNCLEAADGAQAVSSARTANPDLIILDLAIPSPDGFQVVDILSREASRQTPLIVYTALDLSADQKAQLKLGLTAHLTKGVASTDQLVSTIREFLDGLLLRKSDEEDENTANTMESKT